MFARMAHLYVLGRKSISSKMMRVMTGFQRKILPAVQIRAGQRIAFSGQRLDQIAYEEYGDARFWRLLAEANHMGDPFHLTDGQILVIPQTDLE